MYKLLLAEDDVQIQQIIKEYFIGQNDLEIDLDIESDGDSAIERIYENDYDLIILDIMLPGADGFEICKFVRKKSTVPVIFITARGLEEDILHGYDLGCDDYIVKPFSLATFYVKVRALLKRSKGLIGGEELVAGNVSLNPRSMIVKISGQEVDLPQKEYLILKILMENAGAVVSRETLVTRAWGYDYDGDERILDNHMKKLRKLLGTEGKIIKTVIGKGYKIQK